MAKRMSLLAVVAVLLVPVAVASADPRPAPPTSCGDVSTDHYHVTGVTQRFTTCDNARHQAHRFIASEHCRTNTYCTLGHLEWACSSTSQHQEPGERKTHCALHNTHEEVNFYWRRK